MGDITERTAGTTHAIITTLFEERSIRMYNYAQENRIPLAGRALDFARSWTLVHSTLNFCSGTTALPGNGQLFSRMRGASGFAFAYAVMIISILASRLSI